MTTSRFPAPLATLLLLAACAAPAGAPSASATDAASSRAPFETVTPSPSEDAASGAPPEGVPEAAWTAIIDDLSRRLGEPVVDPTVLSAVARTWNDGSLGCPQPGQLYTQALVEGFQVVIEVNGEQFDYRVGRGADIRLCEG